MTENRPRGTLRTLDVETQHIFELPTKKINESEDVSFWLTTWAYTDVMTFLLQLNAAMFPRKSSNALKQRYSGDEAIQLSDAVQNLQMLLQKLETIFTEAPPDPGPRRFGNVSFRKWYKIMEERLDQLLDEHLPPCVKAWDTTLPDAKHELGCYLRGSFGSPQRLDYGTGHELSFIAFLGGIWKLGGFQSEATDWGAEERGIVVGVIEQYLGLVRRLILTYTLEPAGSHGVWGLDDHSFAPYIFGSAQLSPAIEQPEDIPSEGSIPDAPRPGDVGKDDIVTQYRSNNMYFSAIGFINDVKMGPFWEHSPILFDISGVTAGWAKINKGMVKMYNAEVLSKFPVVQHFPFGSLFRWEQNPAALATQTPTKTYSQASRTTNLPPSSQLNALRPTPRGTASLWTSGPTHRTAVLPGPASSWTGQSGAASVPATATPWAKPPQRLSPAASGATSATRVRSSKPSRDIEDDPREHIE